jgi:hypothetical protein
MTLLHKVSVECFRHHSFREANLRLITLLSEIASDYAEAGLRLTVRQLYYQCVARGWIENNEREYQKIIRLLTDAREVGLFDWDAVEDRGARGRNAPMLEITRRDPESHRKLLP